MNAALVTGHPAHALRIFRFLEIYRPIVYIITDGSGSTGVSRLADATKLVEKHGARISPVFCRFSDPQIYEIIREQDTKALELLVDDIVDDLATNNVELVAGDAVEGFNPTHDLCRYLINAVVRIYGGRVTRKIANLDFLLDGPPDHCPPELGHKAIRITLSDGEFARKMAAVGDYPGIAGDIEQAIKEHGRSAFRTECLRPVKDTSTYTAWDGDGPHYERYGMAKVRAGVYLEAITFQRHLRPLADFLASYPGSAGVE